MLAGRFGHCPTHNMGFSISPIHRDYKVQLLCDYGSYHWPLPQAVFPARVISSEIRLRLPLYVALLGLEQYPKSLKDLRPSHEPDALAYVSEALYFHLYLSGTGSFYGDVVCPNTFMMQRLARRYFDEGLDHREMGKKVKLPFVYTFSRCIKLKFRYESCVSACSRS